MGGPPSAGLPKFGLIRWNNRGENQRTSALYVLQRFSEGVRAPGIELDVICRPLRPKANRFTDDKGYCFSFRLADALRRLGASLLLVEKRVGSFMRQSCKLFRRRLPRKQNDFPR